MADIFQEHAELEAKVQLHLQRKTSATRKHCDECLAAKATETKPARQHKNVLCVKYHVLLCKRCSAVV